MLKNKITKVAKDAVAIMDGRDGKVSASQAVKLASAGENLSDESLSRVCTLVNRELHKVSTLR